MSQSISKTHAVYPLYAHLENLKVTVDEQITATAFLSDKQVQQEAVTCLREIKQIIENLVSTIISQKDSSGIAQVGKEAFLRDSKTILQKIHLLANNDRGSKNGDLAKIEKVFKEKIKLPPREKATWQELRLRNEQKLIKASQEFVAFMGNLKTIFSAERIPFIFISYARPLSERPYEVWIEKFLLHFQEHIQAAGINVKFDRTHSPIGGNAYAFMQSIHLVDFVILIGTESLKDKHYSEETRFVQTELNLARAQKDKVLPMLLSGDLTSSFPEAFLGYSVIGDFIDPNSETQTSYLTTLKNLLEIIFRIPVAGDTKKQWDQLWKQFENRHPILAKGLKQTEVEERQKLRKEKQEKKELQRQADELNSRGSASITKQGPVRSPGISRLQTEASRPISQPTLLINLTATYEHFIKREAYIQLEEVLFDKSDFRNRVQGAALYGLGGVGKSELARAFANEYKEVFSFVCWIDAETTAGRASAYCELVRTLEIKMKEHATSEEIQTALFTHLENSKFVKPWLLIYDNVEESLPLPKRGGYVLGTSQDKKLWNELSLIELREFTEDEALIFIKNTTRQTDEASMRDLIKELVAFPLALGQAVADILQFNIQLTDYLTDIREDRSYQLWKRDNTGTINHRRSLAITWQRTLKGLTIDTIDWLNICAYLNPTAISIEWLETWFTITKKLKGVRLKDACRRTLLELRSFGIARFDDLTQSFSLHRLMQELLQHQQTEEQKKQFFTSTTGLISELVMKFRTELPAQEKAKMWLTDAKRLMENPLFQSIGLQSDWIQAERAFADYFAQANEDDVNLLREIIVIKDEKERDAKTRRAINVNGMALFFGSKELQNSKSVVLRAVRTKGVSLVFASEALKSNKEIIVEAVKERGWALEYASKDLRNDKEVVLEAVRENGLTLKYATETLRNDKEVVLEAIKENGRSLKYACLKFRNNKGVVLEAVKDDGLALKYVSKELCNDREVVLEAVKQNGGGLEYASKELCNDREVVLVAIKSESGKIRSGRKSRWDNCLIFGREDKALEFIGEKLRYDRTFILAAVKERGWALEYASKELRNDREVVLAAVKRHGGALEYASKELCNDKEVVLKAIQWDGRVIQYASKELCNDREVVLEAVKHNGGALEYASSVLCNDREIVLEAVKQNGEALKYASKELCNDREIILTAIKCDSWTTDYPSKELGRDSIVSRHQDRKILQYASNELRNDKEVVLKAVKKESASLEYASEELRQDRAFILEVVKENGSALEHASLELCNDREIVREAVKQNGGALEYASRELRKDKAVVLEAVKEGGWSLQYASDELHKDKEVVLEAVKQSGESLKYASLELCKDKAVVLEAVQKWGWSLQYASDELRKDKEVVLGSLKEYSGGLQYVSEELHKDKEIILEVVKKDRAFEYISEEFCKDKDVMHAAVMQHGDALKYASEELRKDKELVIEAVKQAGWALKYASEELRKDKEVVLHAAKKSGLVIKYASNQLRQDREIVLTAVRANCDALKYASAELRDDKEIVLATWQQQGKNLDRLERYEEALIIKQQALDLAQQLYANSAHPDIISLIHSMDRTRNQLETIDLSKIFPSRALEIQRVPREVQQEYQEANWFEKAVQGDANAQNQLALYYEKQRLYDQSVAWYIEASLQNHEDAILNLGTLFEKGHGVPRDYYKASLCYKKAIQLGSDSAEISLAYLLEKGLCGQMDPSLALPIIWRIEKVVFVAIVLLDFMNKESEFYRIEKRLRIGIKRCLI